MCPDIEMIESGNMLTNIVYLSVYLFVAKNKKKDKIYNEKVVFHSSCNQVHTGNHAHETKTLILE